MGKWSFWNFALQQTENLLFIGAVWFSRLVNLPFNWVIGPFPVSLCDNVNLSAKTFSINWCRTENKCILKHESACFFGLSGKETRKKVPLAVTLHFVDIYQTSILKWNLSVIKSACVAGEGRSMWFSW